MSASSWFRNPKLVSHATPEGRTGQRMDRSPGCDNLSSRSRRHSTALGFRFWASDPVPATGGPARCWFTSRGLGGCS